MRGPSPDAVVGAFHAAGVRHAFGLPGTQNVALFEALRSSPLRTVVPSHELGASFMAGGYHRASGRIALLTTIPGPGFTYAATGLAEAHLDSAALVHLTSAPATGPGRAYQLQAIDQAAMAGPVVKAVLGIGPGDHEPAVVHRAVALAGAGEPGPVLVQLGGRETAPEGADATMTGEDLEARVAGIADLVATSRRIVLLVGQGAAGVAGRVTALAERLGAAVVTTTSGRGVVPEDHRLSLGFELSGTRPAPLNELVAASDLVLALGCKFSHNGSRGFGLDLPAAKLVHVDASAAVIGANYPARVGLVGRCEDVVPRLLELVDEAEGWPAAELDQWRRRGLAGSWPDDPEPRFAGRLAAADLIAALREALPREAIVVTDSGRHQMLVRRWLRVLAPRGLMVPTNLQSMGFAIPAAIGARLAAPERPVVAVIGDGGLLMSGLELLTAVKARVPLAVIVFNDGAYGLIQRGQLAAHGTAPGSKLVGPDLAKFADTLGLNFARVGATDPAGDLTAALAMPGVTLIEVPVREAPAMHVVRAKGLAKRLLRPVLRRD